MVGSLGLQLFLMKSGQSVLHKCLYDKLSNIVEEFSVQIKCFLLLFVKDGFLTQLATGQVFIYECFVGFLTWVINGCICCSNGKLGLDDGVKTQQSLCSIFLRKLFCLFLKKNKNPLIVQIYPDCSSRNNYPDFPQIERGIYDGSVWESL